MSQGSDYRRDIDGLRGIAVLAVLFFHAGVRLFGGGYVGVDIFFVISGYLISRILLKETEARAFSIVRFYERRIRRIFPALFFMLALTLGLGAVLLVPEEFKNLGRSSIGVMLFVSNLLFWQEAGYFDAPALKKPLLHTWSLAVEEQFYIFFPLLLLALHRLSRRRLSWVLGALIALSLSASALALAQHPSAVFYWAPLRSWELLLGAVVACEALPRAEDPRLANFVAVLGLAGLLVPIFGFDAETAFPGLSALPPTLGAAAIIHTGASRTTFVGRLLGSRPLVGVGLISYSLYLLHWPLLVFARTFAIVALTPKQTALLLCVTLALAFASWRFVEAPFRSKASFDRRQVFVFAGLGMTLTLSLGVFIRANGGLPNRFAGLEAEEPPATNFNACEERSPEAPAGLCRLGKREAPASFLVWGDSHAAALAPAVDRAAAREGVGGQLALRTGCPPLLGLDRKDPSWHCQTFNDQTLAYLERRPELRTVVLISRWAIFAEGSRYKAEEGKTVSLVAAGHGSPSDMDNARAFDEGLKRTVKAIEALHKSVVLVEEVPEVGYGVPSAFAIARRTGRDVNDVIGPTRDEYLARNRRVVTTFASLKESDGVRLLEPEEKLCSSGRCSVVAAGHSLYSDDNHLSTYGALLVSPTFASLFARVPERITATVRTATDGG